MLEDGVAAARQEQTFSPLLAFVCFTSATPDYSQKPEIRTKKVTQECDWVAENPGPAEHGRDSAQEEPSPRRTRTFQEARTPSREEFRIYSMQTFQHPSLSTQSEPCRRRPVPGDLPNNSFVVIERFHNVLSAAVTRSHTLDMEMVV